MITWREITLVLIGLITGGGGAGAIGHYQYAALQQEMTARTEKLQLQIDAGRADTSAILIELGKLQVKVDDIRERMQRFPAK